MSDDFDRLSDDMLFSHLTGAAGESDMRVVSAVLRLAQQFADGR